MPKKPKPTPGTPTPGDSPRKSPLQLIWPGRFISMESPWDTWGVWPSVEASYQYQFSVPTNGRELSDILPGSSEE